MGSNVTFDLSFRVQCSENYYGPRCNVFCSEVAQQLSCDNEGNVVCVNQYRNPEINCTECLPGRDPSTNCERCLPGRDIDTNCSNCLSGRDLTKDCAECLPGRDLATNCLNCLLKVRDPATNCLDCLLARRDPSTNCSECLLEGRDPATDCLECLPGRHLASNCEILSGIILRSFSLLLSQIQYVYNFLGSGSVGLAFY